MNVSSVNGPFGWLPDQKDVIVTNRTGVTLTRGELVRLDLALASEADTNTPGGELSGFANVVLPDPDVGDWQGILGVVVSDTIADNAQGRIRLTGVVEAWVNGDAVDILVNDPLEVDGGTGGAGAESRLLRAVDGAALIYAIALAGATGAANVRISVLFDGIHGFGGGTNID